MFLPEILYCDRKKIENLLSMLLTDFMTEYKVKVSDGKNVSKGIDAELNGKLGKIAAKYQKSNTFSVEKEGIIQSPTASLLVDLYQILNESNKIQSLKAFDQSIINQLNQGEFIELEGNVTQSPLELAFSSIMDLIEQYHDLFADQISLKDLASYSKLLRGDKATLIIEPFADVETKFLTKIDIKEFDDSFNRYELEGEMKILGRFHKYHGPDKKIDLFDFLPGKLKILKNNPNNPLNELPKALNEMQKAGLSIGDIPDVDDSIMELEGPIIELSSIAIYVNE